MDYSLETVTASSQQEMVEFLKAHENYSLFLLGNFESYGIALTEAAYSGNFKLIRSESDVVAVLCLTRSGNLLIETTVHEPIFDTVVRACLQEPFPIKGLIGNWEFCGRFWDYLKTKNIIQKELYRSKEILYTIELKNQHFPSQPNVRFLVEDDYAQWQSLRADYLIEMNLPNDLTDEQLADLFLELTQKKTLWGYFAHDTLVSMADLNAKALDLGQVGGVYTDPSHRKKGYSRAVLMQLLRDAKELHAIRKMIIFTGEANFPAQTLYTSLGASKIGYFALLFGTAI